MIFYFGLVESFLGLPLNPLNGTECGAPKQIGRVDRTCALSKRDAISKWEGGHFFMGFTVVVLTRKPTRLTIRLRNPMNGDSPL